MSKDHRHVFSSHLASYWKVKTKNLKINGENWSCITLGDPNAEPIIFLHGMGLNKSIWRSQMQNYDGKKYYLVALNVPGACLTQYFENRKHTIHELCRWLDTALDELNIKAAHIIAHSTLTLIATFYAATRPEKVTTLTLLSMLDVWSSGKNIGPGGIVKKLRSDIDLANVDEGIELFNSFFYDPPTLPMAIHKAGFAKISQYIDRFLLVVDDLEQGLPLIMPQTKNIKCPLLIVNGEADRYSTLEFMESLHWHYPKANTVNLLKCAHHMMLEKPKEVFKIHMQFIENGYAKKASEFGNVLHTNLEYA